MIETDAIARQFGLHPGAVRVLMRDAYVKYGRAQTLDAVARALDRNAYSWKYVATILERGQRQVVMQEPVADPRVRRVPFPPEELKAYLERAKRADAYRETLKNQDGVDVA